MRKTICTIFVVAMLSIPTIAQAGTLGCLLGAAAGGFGGAQIGSGNGQLAAVGAGTLLGCGIGSSIQNSDQQQAQPQQVYRPAPNYARRNYYSQPRQYTGYMTSRSVYRQPPVQWQQPRRLPQQIAKSCPYSREYQSTVTVGGRQVPAYGKACSYDGGQNWDLGPLTPAR